MPTPSIQVAVGVIKNKTGQVLLAKRPHDVHQGGLWEFPGGKQEAGEDARTALNREIQEELGLTVLKARPFIKLHYDYPEKSVVLNVWLIQEWTGVPCGREGQPIQWCSTGKLPELTFPAANEIIIKAIQLPPLYLVSPGPGDSSCEFISGIEECLKAGARLLQLRCKEEIFKTSPEMIDQVLSVCVKHDAKLLLNSCPATAVTLNAHGVHLNSARLLQLNERPLDKNYWVSASCHNQIELTHAARIGVDFAVLSPVNPTLSHPGARPIGWETFSRLVEITNIPVYALGGMRPGHLHQAWTNGAQGVAMLNGVWSSHRPADIVRQCINV